MTTALRHTGRFSEGQMIRSYDFAGISNCYVEGLVLDANHDHRGVLAYKIAVRRVVWDGAVCETRPDIVYVPHEVSMFEYDGRIELVDL